MFIGLKVAFGPGMSGRAFLRCTILCVRDTSVLYPSCEKCFSTLTSLSEEHAHPRWSCIRCGQQTELAEYRYRLALQVAKDGEVFGVTLFGASLNSFFGAPAGKLHRFLTSLKQSRGTQLVDCLLKRTLEDCFVGRCVLLEIKSPSVMRGRGLQGKQCGLGQGGSASLSEGYIASRMVLPAEGVLGTTVMAYLQGLLHLCDASEEGTEQDLTGGSQDSYHDYTQLCPVGQGPNADKMANVFLLLALLQSPGLSREERQSPEARPLTGQQAQMVSSNKTEPQSSGDDKQTPQISTFQESNCHESGYSETTRDSGQLEIAESAMSSKISAQSFAASTASSPGPAWPLAGSSRTLYTSADSWDASSLASPPPAKSLCGFESLDSPPARPSYFAQCPDSVSLGDHKWVRPRATGDGWGGSPEPLIGLDFMQPVISVPARLAAVRRGERKWKVGPRGDDYNHSAELFEMSANDNLEVPTPAQAADGCSSEGVKGLHASRPGLVPFSQSTPILPRHAARRRGDARVTSQCSGKDLEADMDDEMDRDEVSWVEADWGGFDGIAGHQNDMSCGRAVSSNEIFIGQADWSLDLFMDSSR